MSKKRSSCQPSLFHRISRRITLALGLALSLLALAHPAAAQMQIVPGISTFAGDGTAGYSGDGGAATSAEMHQTEGVTTDSAGNVYIADWTNNVIRSVAAGTV